MADVSIVLKGVNQASQAINEVRGDLTGLETGATQASSGLSGLGAAIPWAVLGAFALKAGQVALDLEQMREESAQVEARFIGFTGGVKQADSALDAMNITVGNALTRDEKMAAATQLMGLGIAKTAQEAADMTGKALTLGMSVEELARAMETGRTQGLVRYGISTSEVKARVEELQAANANLSTDEARRIAIMEQVTEKSAAVAAAGGLMATSMQQFDNATDTLKDTIADFINLEGIIQSVTRGVTGLTTIMTGTQALQGIFSSPEGSDEQVNAIRNRIEYLQNLVDRSNNGEHIYRFNSENAQAEIDALRDRLNEIQGVDEGLSGMGGFRLAEGYAAAKAEAEGARDAVKDLGGYSEADYAAMSAKNKADDKGLLEQGKAKARQIEQERKDAVRAQEQAAKDAARAWEAEFKRVAGQIKGYLSKGIDAAKGVLDLTGGKNDPFNMGSNGPFEAFGRLGSIVSGGIDTPQDAEWAKLYNVTPETAERILKDFESGLYTPDVKRLIDKGKLLDIFKGEEAATASGEEFVNELAKAAGMKPAAVKAALGIGGAQAQAAVTAPTTVAAQSTFTLNVQPGAVVVTSNAPADIAKKIIDEIFKAFQAAESRLTTPPPALVPGAR